MNKTQGEENNANKAHVTTMTASIEIDQVSTHNEKFLTDYQDFLTHYNHYQKIVKGIEQANFTTQNFLLQLYIQAKEVYSSATNSYQKAIEADLELREKIFTKT